MPRFIVKPKPDEDFYVIYSTIVDAVISWGTREQFLGDSEWGRNKEETERRLSRSDASGTSGMSKDWYGWDDDMFLMLNSNLEENKPDDAWLPRIRREDLKAFCETYSADDDNFHPPAGMVVWGRIEDDD